LPLVWLLSGAARVQPLLRSPPTSRWGRSLPGFRFSTRGASLQRGARQPKVEVASMSCAHQLNFFALPLVPPPYLASVVVGPVVPCWVCACQPPLVPVPLQFVVSSGLADARLRSCFPMLYSSATAPYDLGPLHQSSRWLH